MSDLNIRYSNCFNFINNTKQYLEANPTDWRNIYTEEALAHAECDLMEMELEASYDAEDYDAFLNGNAFRSSKRAQRRKANKKHHKSDRRHGKHRELSRKEQDLIHGGYGAGILWGFRGDKIVPIVSKGSKTNRNRNEKRFDYPMREREIDFLAFDDLFNKSTEIVRQAKKETDPVRKGQLWDLDRDITDAMCVDFYDGWYPDLSVKPERF